MLDQGRMALESLEPEAWERNALEWTAKRMKHVRGALRGIFLGVGLFWIAMGLLLASLYFPQARLILLFATAALAIIFGLWFVAMGLRIDSQFRRRIEHVQEMAHMSNVERHAHIARKVKRRSRARA